MEAELDGLTCREAVRDTSCFVSRSQEWTPMTHSAQRSWIPYHQSSTQLSISYAAFTVYDGALGRSSSRAKIWITKSCSPLNFSRRNVVRPSVNVVRLDQVPVEPYAKTESNVCA